MQETILCTFQMLKRYLFHTRRATICTLLCNIMVIHVIWLRVSMDVNHVEGC